MNLSLEASAILFGIVVLLLIAFIVWQRYKANEARSARLRALDLIAYDTIRDVLVPDAGGGRVHIDFVILTGRGLLVVDFRDVPGVIFGGEHINEWTSINRHMRYAFPNPLGPLYDRVAAVKLAAGESVPAEGRIVFTDRGRFPKGRPPQVSMLSALPGEFPLADRDDATRVERFRDGWERVKSAATPSPLGRG